MTYRRLLFGSALLWIACGMTSSTAVAQVPVPALHTGLVAEASAPDPQQPPANPTPAITSANVGGGALLIPPAQERFSVAGQFTASEQFGNALLEDTNPRLIHRSTVLSPDISVLGTLSNVQYVMQYAPTVSIYETSGSTRTEAFQIGSFAFAHPTSNRMLWRFSASGAYGDAIARLSAPLVFTSVGGSQVLDPAFADTHLVSHTSLGTVSDLSLEWTQSEKQRITFTASHRYWSVLEQGDRISEVGGKVQVNRQLSQRVSLLYFGQLMRSLGFDGCTSGAGGAGLEYKFSDSGIVLFQVGPQIAPANCYRKTGVAFEGGYLQRLGARTEFYAYARRDYAAPYLAQAVWSDGFSVGLERHLYTNYSATADYSFAHINGFTEPAQLGSFLSLSLKRSLFGNLLIAATYRDLYRSDKLSSVRRDLFMVSLQMDLHRNKTN